MKSKLSDICRFVNGKVYVSGLDNSTYISTENMLPNKGGVTEATTLPNVDLTQIYQQHDVLVSNIRPYFKKIWFADQEGGCSNDVLVFRAKEGVDPGFLYYVLADDKFFNYATATSKGTKMPRGDKKSIMEYEVPDFDLDTQRKIASLLGNIDAKIIVNREINKNLEAQSQALFRNWFVDYSPFGGQRPASWTNKSLGEVCSCALGGTPSRAKPEYWNGNIPWMQMAGFAGHQGRILRPRRARFYGQKSPVVRDGLNVQLLFSLSPLDHQGIAANR